MKKKYLSIFIFFGLLVGYGIYYQQKSINILQKYGKYTIATIERIEPSSGRGCSYKVYVSFSYMNRKQEAFYCITFKLDKSYIGRRLFYEFAPNYIGRTSSINYDCSVPDSIQDAPSEGWSVEWMSTHFPTCMNPTPYP